MALRTVQGLLAPAIPSVALAYLARVLDERARPAALAVLSVSFLLSAIAGQAWALLAAPVGWRWALWGLAPLLVVVAVLLPRLPQPARSEAPGSLTGVLTTMAQMVRRPQILPAYTAALTFLLTLIGMYVALERHSAELGAGGPFAGLLMRLPGLPGIVL